MSKQCVTDRIHDVDIILGASINEELEDLEVAFCTRSPWSRLASGEPALSSSRYSDSLGGCGGARGVRVRSEGDEIAKGIAGGGEQERDRRGTGGWFDTRVATMLVVTVGGGVGDSGGDGDGGFGSARWTVTGRWAFGSHTPNDVTLRRYQDTRVRKTKKTLHCRAAGFGSLRD